MDESQDLLRWMSRHRSAPLHTRPPRPTVKLTCWNCGHEITAPRPEGKYPCVCGGVYAEPSPQTDEFWEE